MVDETKGDRTRTEQPLWKHGAPEEGRLVVDIGKLMAFLWTMDGRTAAVTRAQACGPFALLRDGPILVADQLRLPLLLLAEELRVIRIAFYEDEESGEDEGETASEKSTMSPRSQGTSAAGRGSS